MENISELTVPQRPTEKWDDFKGKDHVKRELTFYATFEDKFRTNGLLIFGPPATGKTKLTRGLANRFPQLTFLSICGKSLKLGDIGNVFTLAKKHQPSIIFIEDSELVIPHQDQELPKKTEPSWKQDFVQECHLSHSTGANVLIIIESDEPWKLDRTILKTYFTADIHVQTFSTTDRKKLLMDRIIKSKRFGDTLTLETLTDEVMKKFDGFRCQQMEEVVVDAISTRANRYFAVANCTHVKQLTKTINGFTYEWIPCCPDAENGIRVYNSKSEPPNIDLEKLYIPSDFPMTTSDILGGVKRIRDKGGILQPAFIAKYFAFQKWLYKDWCFDSRNRADEDFFKESNDQFIGKDCFLKNISI